MQPTEETTFPMINACGSSAGPTRSSRPERVGATAPLHDVDRSGHDHTVQIAAAGRSPASRVQCIGTNAAPGGRVLSALRLVALQQERPESLLALMSSNPLARLVPRVTADTRPLFIHPHTTTEEI